MRPLLTFVLAAALLPGVAQAQIKVSNANPIRTVRDLMISALDDPAVQVRVGVTATQRSLRDFRLTREATHFGLDLMRATVRHNSDEGTEAFSVQFVQSSAKALFPYLAPNQVAKLQRVAIARDPAAALGTAEVAFALGLTPQQQERIEAIRLAKVSRFGRPGSPAMKVLQKGYAKLDALGKDSDGKEFDGDMTVETVDTMQKGLDALIDAFEQSTRLYARESAATKPDPLAVLTPAQRRRLRELSSGTLALAKPRDLVARKG